MLYRIRTLRSGLLGPLLIALVSAVGFNGPAGRAETPSPAPPALPFHAEAIRDEIRYLASDALEGRGSGTAGGRKAAAFIAARFRAAGLQPLGTSGSYFQPFRFTAGVRLGSRNGLSLHRSGGRPEPLRVRQGFMPL